MGFVRDTQWRLALGCTAACGVDKGCDNFAVAEKGSLLGVSKGARAPELARWEAPQQLVYELANRFCFDCLVTLRQKALLCHLVQKRSSGHASCALQFGSHFSRVL